MKLYAVFPVYNEQLYTVVNHISGAQVLNFKQANNPNFGIFTKESHAKHFAASQVAINGGFELCVAEVTSQYFAKASPVHMKQWKGDELLPI